MLRLLPLLLLAVLAVGTYFYLPARRMVVYRLGISGDPTTSCCNEEEISRSTGKFEESATVAFFNNEIIDYPKTSLAANFLKDNPQVLGTKNASGEDKWIEVSLAQQMLRAWEGNNIIMEFPISSGLWYPTPTGDFSIWHKTKYQRMKGGSQELGTYYDLPNVPNNMFFFKGFAIHGAYWHNNFGNPMSHGCVNAPLAQVAELFAWAGPFVEEGENVAHATDDNPGTRVFVH